MGMKYIIKEDSFSISVEAIDEFVAVSAPRRSGLILEIKEAKRLISLIEMAISDAEQTARDLQNEQESNNGD